MLREVREIPNNRPESYVKRDLDEFRDSSMECAEIIISGHSAKNLRSAIGKFLDTHWDEYYDIEACIRNNKVYLRKRRGQRRLSSYTR